MLKFRNNISRENTIIQTTTEAFGFQPILSKTVSISPEEFRTRLRMYRMFP